VPTVIPENKESFVYKE